MLAGLAVTGYRGPEREPPECPAAAGAILRGGYVAHRVRFAVQAGAWPLE